jgi:hypothetical protein
MVVSSFARSASCPNSQRSVSPKGFPISSVLNTTAEMIADGLTEVNEGNQELRYLCDLLFK